MIPATRRLTCGDEEALFRRHHGALVRAVRRAVCASDALIEDACAVAWLQLIRTQPERGPALFGWLRTVAIHEAYSLSVGERRELALEALGGPASGDGRAPDGWEALIEGACDFDRQLEARRALEALAELPAKQRLYLGLFVAGFRYEEIAQLCGATYTNVNKHLTRARARARELRARGE